MKLSPWSWRASRRWTEKKLFWFGRISNFLIFPVPVPVPVPAEVSWRWKEAQNFVYKNESGSCKNARDEGLFRSRLIQTNLGIEFYKYSVGACPRDVRVPYGFIFLYCADGSGLVGVIGVIVVIGVHTFIFYNRNSSFNFPPFYRIRQRLDGGEKSDDQRSFQILSFPVLLVA